MVESQDFFDTCNKALDLWGVDLQQDICIEECAELVQAICKIKRYGYDEDAEDRLVSEIADVTIMLHQMTIAYNVSAKVDRAVGKKILRLQNRIKEATA